jgi:hypothetical protein
MVAPPPAEDPVAAPALLTLTDAGWEELQVSGTPLIVVPTESMTVGVMVFEVLLEEVTVSVIEFTAHVVKYIGRLLIVPIVANKEVRPGTFAVTWACPGSRPDALAFTVATFVAPTCQVKIPTVGVISTPLLNAAA